jgi:hypothetical protein
MAIIPKILTNTFNDPSIYVIELKIQDKDGLRDKLFDEEEITLDYIKKHYDDFNFIKFDFVINVDNTFTELSIIFSFNKDRPDIDIIKKSFNDDIKLYTKKGIIIKC